MNRQVLTGVLLLVLAGNAGRSQTFSIVPRDTVLSSPLGTEMVFTVVARNLSSGPLTLSLTRTENALPAGWQSALCIDVFCFSPIVDSIATTKDFGSGPLNPGDTLLLSVHVTSQTTGGTGIVRVTARDLSTPESPVHVTCTAHSGATGAAAAHETAQGWRLEQNYPNPWNPTTHIAYTIARGGFVTLELFDLLGRPVASLVHGFQAAGAHSADVDVPGLAAGTYVYRLTCGGFAFSRTMVLIK
jgi:hypothetical protein